MENRGGIRIAILTFILGYVLGGVIIGACCVAHGADDIDDLLEINEKSLELANKYANRLVKLKNEISSYPYYIPEDDKQYLIDIIDGRDNEWLDTKK